MSEEGAGQLASSQDKLNEEMAKALNRRRLGELVGWLLAERSYKPYYLRDAYSYSVCADLLAPGDLGEEKALEELFKPADLVVRFEDHEVVVVIDA